MIDMDNDGVGDAFDMEVRILGMEAMRILEAALERLRENREKESERAKEMARQDEARYNAQATLARADLAPVMGEKFWKDADLEAISGKYAQARAFASVDETFAPFQERIESRAKDLHDLTPEQILAGPVPPGPRPMTDEQVAKFVTEVSPGWYKQWAAQQLKDIDRIRNDGRRRLAHVEHNELIRQDMEHWRDTGTQSMHASKIQEEWLSGDRRSWGRKVDPSESFQKLTDETRRAYGWRPGGARIDGPLSVDDARLIAATAAPQWYRVQEMVTQDLAPAIRERLEMRLVEDMTNLRDTGRLDTASAKEEWARFSGHELSVQGQDPNESLTEFRDRTAKAFGVHWELTVNDREHLAEPHGERVGKPMSVSQAEDFAQLYAPDWVRERHAALQEEAGRNPDPDRVAWEQTVNREQFRYAMEEARDTGALSHPYVAALRSQAAMLGVDESEGMRHVPSTERVRFGGPEARPLTQDESLEIMQGWAPPWYKDQVNRMLRPSEVIDESAQRVTLDAVRADMTTLRDRGTLSSDHAQRLWAASQPGFDPSDPDSRKAMDRREQLWVETVSKRQGPDVMDANNRERFGGHSDASQDRETAEQLDARRAVEEPFKWRDDTLARMDREDAADARMAVEEPFAWRDKTLAQMDQEDARRSPQEAQEAPAPTQGAERPAERPRGPQEREGMTQPVPVVKDHERGAGPNYDWAKEAASSGRVEDLTTEREKWWATQPASAREKAGLADARDWDAIAAREKAKTEAPTWETKPVPGKEPPAREERPKGPVWDSVERRNQDAMNARGKFSADAVDGMVSTDYGHSRKPKAQSSGKPAWFDQEVERAAERHRQQQQSKGMGR